MRDHKVRNQDKKYRENSERRVDKKVETSRKNRKRNGMKVVRQWREKGMKKK